MSESVFGQRPQDDSLPADQADTVVESTAWVELDRWMDEQLELLIARWKPMAAPRASQRTGRNQFGR